MTPSEIVLDSNLLNFLKASTITNESFILTTTSFLFPRWKLQLKAEPTKGQVLKDYSSN